MARRPITVDEVAAGLRALADEFESGYRAVPQPGHGLQRVAGVPIVPIVVHDALCGWRVASEQEDTTPPVLACAGCGLGFLRSEAEGRRGPRPPEH